jgi:predicted esterase
MSTAKAMRAVSLSLVLLGLVALPPADAGEPSTERYADTADVPAQDLTVEGNDKMRYFLIGAAEGAELPKDGYKLVVVMPGGDGGEDFHPFVRRLYKHAMSGEFLVAQPVAFKWLSAQRIVWPTKVNPTAGQKFSTEQFVEAVIQDVGRRHPIDQRCVFTLSWSSSGPAAYAISLQEETAVKGSYIAMSVFRRQWLPPLDAAKGHFYWLDHSPEDTLCPFSHAKQAEQDLAKAGATVRLTTYPDGHGWRGDVYGRVRSGITWLVEQARDK